MLQAFSLQLPACLLQLPVCLLRMLPLPAAYAAIARWRVLARCRRP